MECKAFGKDIGEFASRPLLQGKMVEIHLRDVEKCVCGFEDLREKLDEYNSKNFPYKPKLVR